jgi:hypothetical protein
MRPEQIHKVGEFNEMPKRLMEEFAQERRTQSRLTGKPVTE